MVPKNNASRLSLWPLVILLAGLTACGGPYPRQGQYSPTGSHKAASAGAGYVVQPGDTVYGIAHRHGVELSALAQQNGIAPPYTIAPGQVLVLPGLSAAPGPSLASAAPTGPETAPLAAPVESVSATPLAAPQPTSPQVLTPAPEPVGVQAAPPQPEAPQPVAAEPLVSVPGEGLAAPAAPEAAPQPVSAPGPAVLPEPPARAGSKFIWPVDGTLLSGFGPKPDGMHNDGINIGAPEGAPVKAAENGVVAYAGQELRGFGILILIKHQDDYVTAYAHNEQVLVKRGDIVRRGETIARVGSSGSVDTPQLHFEIRKGSRAIDPLTVMVQQSASR